MREHKPNFQSPQAAAFVGFVLAAVSSAFTVVTCYYWQVMADALESLPPGRRSGGSAFAVNIPGIALEVVSFTFGMLAMITLGGVLMWRPRVIKRWFTVAGLLCLMAPLAFFVLWLRAKSR